MFFGEFRHSLDNKRRVTLPAAFRGKFGDGVFITKGFERCLAMYTRTQWQAVLDRANSLDDTVANNREYQRYFYSGAMEDKLDSQGRIQIPQNLMEYAFLEKDAVIIGVGNHVEIWSKDKWESYSALAEGRYEELAENLPR